MSEVGDILLARLKGRFDSEPFVTSLAFNVLNPNETFALTANDLFGELNTVFDLVIGPGDWTTGLSAQFAFEECEIVDVLPGLSGSYRMPIGSAGTIDDEDALPPNDCLCITWYTDKKGVGGRGRTYLNGFAESAQNAGYWEAGTQTHAIAVANDIMGQWGPDNDTASFRFGVLHRMEGGSKLDPPVFNYVFSYAVHNQVRSLARRAVGRRIPRKRAAP